MCAGAWRLHHRAHHVRALPGGPVHAPCVLDERREAPVHRHDAGGTAQPHTQGATLGGVCGQPVWSDFWLGSREMFVLDVSGNQKCRHFLGISIYFLSGFVVCIFVREQFKNSVRLFSYLIVY